MPDMCDNNLLVIGEQVEQFINDYIDKEINVDKERYEPAVIKLYDTHEPVEIYSWELHQDELVINFETSETPPCDWLRDTAENYTDLQFELRYAEQGADFSGYMLIDADTTIHKEDRSGVYYGFSFCGYCENDIHYLDYYDDEYSCCDECLIEINTSRDTISDYIRTKKIKKVNQSIALKRMGRNRIMDNYLMRKVFVKRIYE